MILSRVVGHRLIGAAAALALAASLSACSGSDAAPTPDEPTATATATAPVDAARSEVDQALLKALVNQYWAASMLAAEVGDDSGKQFDGIARDGALESALTSIRDATADGLVRAGAPEVSKVAVTIDATEATIVACLDEDDWPFVRDGVELDGQQLGPVPWGARATRIGDAWIITDVGLDDSQTQEKDCG